MAGGIYQRPLAIPQAFGPNGQPLDIDTIVQQQLARPNHTRAYCKVYLNGQDLTSKLDPVLLSVRITDRKFGSSTASLTLDDRYGQIPNPPDGSQCSIALGWPEEGTPKQFTGVLTNVVSSGQRQSGRTLDVEFASYDQAGPGKTPVTMNWGAGKDVPEGKPEDIPFSKIAEELAKKAGLTNFKVAPSLGSITQKRWDVRGETPLGALERFARELGGSFKVDGPNAGISDPRSGQAADGTPLTARTCVVGENVIAWRIIPSVRRAQWGSLWHGFFDRDAAAPRVSSAEPLSGFGFPEVQAKRMAPWPTNDADAAKTRAKGDAYTAVQKRGTGWTVVDGMPQAVAGVQYSLNGYRPGVDGTYNAEEVEHSYFRAGGYITRIDVEDPQLYDSSAPSSNWKPVPN